MCLGGFLCSLFAAGPSITHTGKRQLEVRIAGIELAWDMNVAALFLKHLPILGPWTNEAAPENLSSCDLAGQIKIYRSQMLERFSLGELEYAPNLHRNCINAKQAHHETISRMGNEQIQAY